MKEILKIVQLFVLLMAFIAVDLKMSNAQTYPDNMLIADCVTGVQPQPWNAHVLNSVDNIHCYYVPIVGDMDGDGEVEIVVANATSNDHYTTQLGIYRGSNLQQIATIQVPQQLYAGFTGPMALVRYPDGNGGMQGAVILHCLDKKLRSYDIHGQLLAISDVNTPCEGCVSITDFNYDGWPEIYIGNAIYDAATLQRLCAGPANGNMGRSHRDDGTVLGYAAMPFAADVLGDSLPELICGNTIYNVNIASRTDMSQNSVTELKTISIPSRIPQDGNVAVADFNKDGQIDVMVVIDGTKNTIYDSSYFYAYDPATENILFTHGHYSGTVGYPLVGDINGDDDLDLVYLDLQHNVSSSRITAISYNPATGTRTLWQATHGDESGQTSMTLFDFNQDGIKEIVYRDQDNLRIINGSGRSHRTGNDTITFYNLYTLPMYAGTWKEYPVVADVNGDGAAEIVVCGKTGYGLGWVGGQLVVVGGIIPWAPARPVWNQYMYNVTNINKDLTVPVPLFDNATAFTDPQGTVRRPFNNFLEQATTLDQYGMPFSRMLNVTAADTSYSQEDGVLTITFQFCNTGGQTLNSPYSITYYADTYQGPIILTETMTTPLAVDNCITITKQFTSEELTAFPDIENIVIAINDHGEGVAQIGGQQEECDTTDNFFVFPVHPCDIPRDTITAEICMHETYHDENFDISSVETAESGTRYFQRTYPVGECDSVIVLKLVVHPSYHFQYLDKLSEGSDYHNFGIDLYADDLDTIAVIDTTLFQQTDFGCDSILDLTIMVIPKPMALYLPNAITPSNCDGLNDEFYIPEAALRTIATASIYIYNRWGECVYNSEDKHFKWDGTVRGKRMPNTIYNYVLKVEAYSGQQFLYKGSITVL